MKTQLLLVSLVSCASLNAQEVVSTQGDYYSNSSGSIAYTVGEVVIDTGTDGTNDITQGFHQTNWNFAGLTDYKPDFSASVFPNPTSEMLNIRATSFEGVSYELYDAKGSLIRTAPLSGELTTVPASSLAPGSYSVRLKQADGQPLKSFQLIKHN